MRRTITLALSSLVPLLAALAVVPAGHAATEGFSHVWDRGAGGERYVALGDSFTSGPGIAPQRPEGCSRSQLNFPSLVARALDAQLSGGLTAYTDASCGGARTRDLTTRQTGTTNPPQLDALGDDTTLVTFGTLGGNDIGLVQLALACFTDDCVPAPGTDPNKTKFAALETSLANGIAEARTRAPKARIVVIGYGTYLPPGGCVDTFGGGLTLEEFAYLQGEIDRMSDTLARVAAAQQVDFVDMRDIPGSVEHTACAAPERQWIRAIEAYGDGYLLHPSACGMDAMAQHVTRTLQQLRGEVQTPFDGSCVSAGPVAPTAPPTTPNTGPEQDRAAKLAALRAEATTLRLRATCRREDQARLRVHGTTDHVSRVRFSVRGDRLAVDPRAPFRTTVKAGRLPRRGKLGARVTLRDGDVTISRQLRRERPRCLR